MPNTICCENNSDFAKNFFRALPGLHALLGCDSTIAFNGIGKRKWLNIVKGNEEYCNALGLLGESLQIEDHLFDMTESMLCQAYRFLNKRNVNDVRYEKFCRKKSRETFKIPPTKDDLHQRVKRANYEAFVWKKALEANQEISESDQHGWSVIDETMSMCQYVLQQVPCTDICKRKGECHNEVPE